MKIRKPLGPKAEPLKMSPIMAQECEADKLLWKIKNALAKAVCKDLDRRILEDT